MHNRKSLPDVRSIILSLILLMSLTIAPMKAYAADSDTLDRVNGLRAIPPTVEDLLNKNEETWTLKPGLNNGVSIQADGLHVRSRTTDADEPSLILTQSNLAADALFVEVEARHVRGTLFNGFGFYLMESPDDYIFFYISNNGYASIRRGALDEQEILVPWQKSSAIQTQSRATNQLSLLIENGYATLFANGSEVARVDGLALEEAKLGLMATSYEKASVEVAYRDLRYWKLANAVPPTPEEYIDMGKNHLDQAEWQQAVEALTQAIELEPDNAEAYFLRGLAYYQLGNEDDDNYSLAISDLTKAMESEEFAAKAITVRNKINQVADAEKLLATYSDQIEDTEDPTAAYVERAIVYRDRLGDYENAIADLTQAINMANKYQRGDYYVERAFTHMENGDAEAAIEDTSQAIEDKNTTRICTAYAYRGGAYAQVGDYVEAESDLSQAQSECGDNLANLAFVNHHLGILRYKKVKIEEAISLFNSAIDNQAEAARDAAKESWEDNFADEPEESFDTIITYFESLITEHQLQTWREGDLESEFEEYLEVFKTYEEIYAASSRAHGWLGGIYWEQTDYEQAIESYTTAIDLDPTDTGLPGWYLKRGWIFFDEGDFDAARDDLTLAVALGKSDTLDTATAYNLLGLIASEDGTPQEEISYYSKAISIDPNEAVFYYNRGLVYYDLDDYNNAIVDFGKVLELTEDEELREEVEEWLDILE